MNKKSMNKKNKKKRTQQEASLNTIYFRDNSKQSTSHIRVSVYGSCALSLFLLLFLLLALQKDAAYGVSCHAMRCVSVSSHHVFSSTIIIAASTSTSTMKHLILLPPLLLFSLLVVILVVPYCTVHPTTPPRPTTVLLLQRQRHLYHSADSETVEKRIGKRFTIVTI